MNDVFSVWPVTRLQTSMPDCGALSRGSARRRPPWPMDHAAATAGFAQRPSRRGLRGEVNRTAQNPSRRAFPLGW